MIPVAGVNDKYCYEVYLLTSQGDKSEASESLCIESRHSFFKFIY